MAISIGIGNYIRNKKVILKKISPPGKLSCYATGTWINAGGWYYPDPWKFTPDVYIALENNDYIMTENSKYYLIF